MPFDPTKPADNSLADAAELRGQLNALQSQITALQTTLADVQLQVNNMMTPDDISDAINNNAAGPVRGVNLLGLSISNPPTQTQVQTIVNRFDEALTGLKRL